MATCRVCGGDLRAGDDAVMAGDEEFHLACVEAPARRPRRRLGAWAAMGSGGQMAMGETQRGVTP